MTSSSTSWKKTWILNTVTSRGMTQWKATYPWGKVPLSNPHARWEALHPALFIVVSVFLAGCWNPYIHLFYFLPFIFNSETLCPLLDADIKLGVLKTVAGGATGCRVWEITKYFFLEWNPGLGMLGYFPEQLCISALFCWVFRHPPNKKRITLKSKLAKRSAIS